MNQDIREKYIHRVFIGGVLLKALNGVLEIVGGVLLLFTGTFVQLVEILIRNELIEDPTDFLAMNIQHYLPLFTGHAQLFAAVYLLSHGIIKIVLVVGLLRNKLWAYPAAIVVFFLFIAYQMYRYTFTHSVFLIFFTIFDIFVIVLTWHEYKYFKKHHSFPH